MAEQIKDLDNLKPIDHAVSAKPHTAVYKMHRYFARRPWSVFRALVEHYSNPGSIILDPFCGGGVTVVEGLRLRRKVIAVDINPLATFVTRMEVLEAEPDDIQEDFERLGARCRNEIEALYKTRCEHCQRQVTAEWFEWSNVYGCPFCDSVNVISDCEKRQPGQYKCVKCEKWFKPLDAKQHSPILLNVFVKCPSCKTREVRPVTDCDVKLAQSLASVFKAKRRNLGALIPTEQIPDGNMPRENALSRRGIRYFADFFTKRNLLSNAILRKALRAANSPFLWLAFSASLKHTNKLVQRVKGFAGGQPEWSRHAFWPPEVFGEINVWRAFSKSVAAVKRGKAESYAEIGSYAVEASRFDDLCRNATFYVLTQSAHKLPLPDNSVDVVITDPPYGDNVQYIEMSNFWLAWLQDHLGVPVIEGCKEEAIETRRRGFPGAKSHRHYRNMLLKVFEECYRVLKPGRWMVMTFHNKKFRVWNALHLAAHDAGFRLPEHDGVIYQPPIKLYESISHTKYSGAMVGDFVLSFEKVEEPPTLREIERAEIGRHVERLAAEAVLHHRGASLSTIYMKLIPWLLNNNLLNKITEKELAPYLQANFEEREGVWYLKDEPDRALRQDLERYSKQHYKASYDKLDFVPIQARIEYLIRRLLYGRGYATQDDVLNQIYTNLINSNMAEVREIQRVLESLADLVPLAEAVAGRVAKSKRGRKVWKLKEDIERERLWREMGADVEYRLASSEESDHDLAIARLVEIAGLRKLKAHIGRTEQTKYTEFRRMSSPLPKRIQGLPKAARRIIEQIDVLWHNGGRGVVAAFEVERTSTITSGIDRFRNLLAVVRESEMQLYIVVPKARGDEVRRKIGSPANRKAGLHRRIGYVYLQDLQIRSRDPSVVKFEKITHYVGDK